jgi:predicted RNase H-like HicB family nuclease
MLYPVVIEPGDEHHAFGVIVPDLPGCFSGGDTFEEALGNAREAIELQIEALLDAGEGVPEPDINRHAADPAYRGFIWAFVDVPVEALDERVERVNITLPRRVLYAIDKAAERSGRNRSAFLAEAGLKRAREVSDQSAPAT